ncbi:MAG TPA: pilus assembly protein TadG-related protein [Candidatus Binataceae bacterium]|nr:pilus assembly protein TadG-related protein [Candidatus Binataceae bacterium]
MKFRRAHRGQIIVLVALSVTVLLGFLGLATDVGVLWATKRKAQTAADAAAVAGVNATLGSDSSGYSTAATDVATLNGFTSGSAGTTVTVTEPSPSGYPSGTYVQVNITRQMTTYFLGVLGYKTIPVTVSALAGDTSGANTIIALNGSGNGITIDSSAVNVGCGLISNSSSSSALTVTNGGSLSAATVGVVGGTSGNVPSNTKTNVSPVQNPFNSWTKPTPNSCNRQSTNNSGTKTINSTTTCASNKVYDGGSGNCGYSIQSPTNRSGQYTPISVTFSGGNCGNHISCGGSGQPTCQNVTCTFNPGQYQCVNTSSGGGGGWGSASPSFRYANFDDKWGSGWRDESLGFVRTGGIDQYGGRYEYVWGGFGTVTPSIEIGPNASGCTANFNSGSYTFLGNVSICGNNTVNLQPGTYCNGITIADDSYGNSPTVNFAPGTYICAGGGLNISGHCTLSGTGCTFHNCADTSSDGYSSGPISCGAHSSDSVHCTLSAPTSGSCKGMLFTQDSAIGGSSSWGSGWGWGSSSSTNNCTVKCDSSSTCDGACYIPNSSCTYGVSSSSSGYSIVVADSVTLSGSTTQTQNCNYTSLSNGISPIRTSALYK